MLSVTTRAGAVAAVVLVATACSSAPDPTAPPAPTAVPASGPDRAAIVKTFDDYDQALLSRDFAKVCSLTAPQAVTAMIKSLGTQGTQVATCEKAFAAVYAIPEAVGPLDADARTAKVDDVVVAGDTATVTYSSETNGPRKSGLTSTMQRINGQWRMLGSG